MKVKAFWSLIPLYPVDANCAHLWPDVVVIMSIGLAFTCRYTCAAFSCLASLLPRLGDISVGRWSERAWHFAKLHSERFCLYQCFPFPLLPALCDWVNRHSRTLKHMRISSQTAYTSGEFALYACRFRSMPLSLLPITHRAALSCLCFMFLFHMCPDIRGCSK